MLKYFANGVYGEDVKQIMLDMVLNPRKFNSSLLDKLDGEIITFDPKNSNSTSINPFELDTKHDIIDMNMIERLKQGGFKNALEVLELVSKVRESNYLIANSLFNEWWNNDGSKEGLSMLIKKLNL
ncbi:MAG: hypothetical protein MJA82_06235 [Clostridia bacterium]|nr:hypothetical protein [Clostridia bacterium]